MSEQTLLVVLSHPDDEVLVAGTLLAQRARGDRVVVVWLTRGEMTEAFGPVAAHEVARRREELANRAGDLLGVETRFLDYPDGGVRSDPDTAAGVARVVAEVQPDALVTWGDAWVRGMRHPDHQATGAVARDAVSLARIRKLVEPVTPHRGDCRLFTIRGAHSTLPTTAVDVTAYGDGIFELAAFYRETVGFGERGWIERRLRRAGARWGVKLAEELDAWESRPGLVQRLLPVDPGDHERHPPRPEPAT